MMLQALFHIHAMRGRTKPQLMYCDNGEAYVVKFFSNPFGPHVLACDYLATQLAHRVGLPVPPCELVQVAGFLIEHTDELSFLKGQCESDETTVHFGSRHIGGVKDRLRVIDVLPEDVLLQVQGIETFAGMLAFDKWCSNVDERTAVFSRAQESKEYRAHFIDHGECFAGSLSSYVGERGNGLYRQRSVYQRITSWDSFEPVLSRLTAISPEVILAVARELPAAWYKHNESQVESLIDALLQRRARIHHLLAQLRDREPAIFPNWQRRSSVRFSSRHSVFSITQEAARA